MIIKKKLAKKMIQVTMITKKMWNCKSKKYNPKVWSHHLQILKEHLSLLLFLNNNKIQFKNNQTMIKQIFLILINHHHRHNPMQMLWMRYLVISNRVKKLQMNFQNFKELIKVLFQLEEQEQQIWHNKL
jgi:hypothetical protein